MFRGGIRRHDNNKVGQNHAKPLELGFTSWNNKEERKPGFVIE
jgi:hypothetical protein